MTPPRALRLVCTLAGARAKSPLLPPPPPFGLAAYVDDDGADIAVLLDLDAEASERAQVEVAAAQIPAADDQPAGRRVFVLAARANVGGFFARIFARGRGHVTPAVRATALLARGYVNLGSDDSGALKTVWGEATPSPS